MSSMIFSASSRMVNSLVDPMLTGPVSALHCCSKQDDSPTAAANPARRSMPALDGWRRGITPNGC